VLSSIITSRSDIRVTEIDTIKNLWGKADFGSGDRNRNEGATLFMSAIAYIGLGKSVIGSDSNSTRIEWIDDIKDKINSLNQESPIVEQKKNTSPQGKNTIEASIIDTVPVEEKQEENTPDVIIADERNVKPIMKPISAVSLPNITINVDMSDWSDEKIKTFFKYAYGKFEED